MSAKLMDTKITRLVAVVGGLEDQAKPTVEELENAADITCAVEYGYTLGMGESETVDGKMDLCADGKSTSRAAATYSAELTILREGDVNATEQNSAYLRAADIFKDPDTILDLVRRGGVAHAVASVKPQTEPFVEGDIVEVYRFRTDYPQYRTGVEVGQDADFTARLMPTGQFQNYTTVVASRSQGGQGGQGGGGQDTNSASNGNSIIG